MKNDRPDLPPQDLAAEKGLLGGLLRDNHVFDDIRSGINAEDFYTYAHQRLFTCIAGFLDAGQPCDLVILFNELKSRGWAEDVGGAAYLAECWEAAPTGAEANYYAGLVRDAAKRRRLIHVATEMQRDCYDGHASADELAAKFESDLFRVSDNSTADEPIKLSFIVDDVFNEIGQPPKPGTFIRTGIDRLDAYIGGLMPGKLYVFAARPSVGKSAIMQQIVEHAAKYEGATPLVFSMEMPREELTQRTIARVCQVPLNVVTNTTKPSQQDYDKLFANIANCKTSTLVYDCEDNTAATIAAVSRRAVKKSGVNLIAIDYLQLIEHHGERGDTLATRIGNTTRAFKKLSRRLKVPVVLLSQLSRDIEKRGPESEPQLSDLRDSGAIEQDADVVIFLHPRAVTATDPPPKEQQIDAFIRKQRGGPKGKAELMYERAVLTFRDKPNSNW